MSHTDTKLWEVKPDTEGFHKTKLLTKTKSYDKMKMPKWVNNNWSDFIYNHNVNNHSLKLTIY